MLFTILRREVEGGSEDIEAKEATSIQWNHWIRCSQCHALLRVCLLKSHQGCPHCACFGNSKVQVLHCRKGHALAKDCVRTFGKGRHYYCAMCPDKTALQRRCEKCSHMVDVHRVYKHKCDSSCDNNNTNITGEYDTANSISVVEAPPTITSGSLEIQLQSQSQPQPIHKRKRTEEDEQDSTQSKKQKTTNVEVTTEPQESSDPELFSSKHCTGEPLKITSLGVPITVFIRYCDYKQSESIRQAHANNRLSVELGKCGHHHVHCSIVGKYWRHDDNLYSINFVCTCPDPLPLIGCQDFMSLVIDEQQASKTIEVEFSKTCLPYGVYQYYQQAYVESTIMNIVNAAASNRISLGNLLTKIQESKHQTNFPNVRSPEKELLQSPRSVCTPGQPSSSNGHNEYDHELPSSGTFPCDTCDTTIIDTPLPSLFDSSQ